MLRFLFFAIVMALVACNQAQESTSTSPVTRSADHAQGTKAMTEYRVKPENYEFAIFAGGCFWCMETPFEEIDGIAFAESGYTGGKTENPTYQQIGTGTTGHYEAVRIAFDPEKISYETLLEIFWRQIDPTDAGGQFADRGSQYQTAIFTLNDEQAQAAATSKKVLMESGRFAEAIVTPIIDAAPFYPAEEYHQNYACKAPLHYNRYKEGSGRASFIERMWGEEKYVGPERPEKYGTSETDEELKERLGPIAYNVVRENGTERPFTGKYNDNKDAGIYVDIVSGEPLFASIHKFDSGCGWPSFTQPIAPKYVEYFKDSSHGMQRTEIRSKYGDSHLGHIFDDGPKPTGLRYCINSASLRFVPVADLEKEGLGRYLHLFNEGMDIK